MENQSKTSSNYVNINGIPKVFCHERTNPEGNTYYSVGVQVPYEFSKNGFANVSVNRIFETKNDPDKINIGFPKKNQDGTDRIIKVSVCTYNDRENSKNNKYDKVELTPSQLLSKHIDFLNIIKEKETKEPTLEEDGMDR